MGAKSKRLQTDLLQSDNLSLSCVIPSLLELSLHLQDSTFTKSLALPLLQSLRRRFAVFLEPSSDLFDPLAATACLLDPTVMTTVAAERHGTTASCCQVPCTAGGITAVYNNSNNNNRNHHHHHYFISLNNNHSIAITGTRLL